MKPPPFPAMTVRKPESEEFGILYESQYFIASYTSCDEIVR
jgi:hypothetical protein